MSKKHKILLSQKQQKQMEKLLAQWGLEQSGLTPEQNRVISAYVRYSSKQKKSYVLIIICAAAMAATAFIKLFEAYNSLSNVVKDDVILYKIVTEDLDHVVDLNTFKLMVAQYFGAVSFAVGFTVFAVSLIFLLVITLLWTKQHKSAIDVLLKTISGSKTNN
jgi:hypothetical protein